MSARVLQLAADLARRRRPFVLAHVVYREPPSSARAGDLALVSEDGVFHGWVGGSCTRPTVVREATRALADGRPRLLHLSPPGAGEERPGVATYPMTCHSGGSVELYIQPVFPAPRLVVIGDTPVADALARLGAAMAYEVDSVTDVRRAEPQAWAADPALALVVATTGEADEEALEAALRAAPSYVAVVASRTRFNRIRERLGSRGIRPEVLDAIHCPAGLDIGAESPEEIALSIVAELVAERRRERVAPGRLADPAAALTEATDPVCGMSVPIATARHVVQHEGRSYYFCCGGCRERFEEAPSRYAAAGAAGGSGP